MGRKVFTGPTSGDPLSLSGVCSFSFLPLPNNMPQNYFSNRRLQKLFAATKRLCVSPAGGGHQGGDVRIFVARLWLIRAGVHLETAVSPRSVGPSSKLL